jgi:hypothetical protein
MHADYLTKILVGIFLAVSLAFVQPAHAFFICTGVVSDISVNPAGDLYLGRLAGQHTNILWTKLCNVAAPVNGISVDACKQIRAVLVLAQMTGQPVDLYFDYSGSSAHPCDGTTFPAWQLLSTTGPDAWYWGPSLR